MIRYRLKTAAEGGFADATDAIALTGWLLTLALVAFAFRAHSLAAPLTKQVTTLEWILVGVAVPALVAASALVGPTRRLIARYTRIEGLRLAIFMLRAAGIVLAIALTLWIGALAHRLAMLLPAAATAAILGGRRPSLRFALVTGAAAWIGWWAAESISYTRVDSLLLSATPTDAFVLVAFACALVLVVADAARPAFGSTGTRERRIVWSVFLSAAVVLALRTDILRPDWIFYHRSYYTGAAALVREHGWLLWDVPSQYGFLSILTIASLPGRSTWDSLDLLIAIAGVAQAAAIFALLRYERRGVRSAIVAGLVALVLIFTSDAQRWPVGEMAYPQFGLRTLFLIAGVTIVVRRYLAGDDARSARRLLRLGNVVYAVAAFWSFEVAVWQTLFWLPVVVTIAAVDARAGGLRGMTIRIVRGLAEPIVMVAFVAGVVAGYYVAILHHVPDVLGYVEFSLAYSGKALDEPEIWRYGPGFFVLASFGLAGTVLLWTFRNARWHALPVAVAAWLAVWVSASYFAAEAFADHVNALVPLFVVVGAACGIVLRREGAGALLQATLRAASLPVVVLCVACAATTDQWRTFSIPPPWHVLDAFESTTTVLEPELEGLLERGGVGTNDAVVFPNQYGWAKTSAGMIMPFRRMRDGSVVAVRNWLPYGPAGIDNAIMTLPWTRRQVYVDRYLTLSARGGYYVTYHEPADCGVLSPRLESRLIAQTVNFSLASCSLRAWHPGVRAAGLATRRAASGTAPPALVRPRS